VQEMRPAHPAHSKRWGKADKRNLEGDEIEMVITVLYYLLTGAIAFLMIHNFIRSKKWQEEALYILVLLPFLLRLFRLK
jgi:hypothetical protein